MIKQIFISMLIVFGSVSAHASDCGDADATTWCIESSDTTVDGDTFCSGTCDPGDTLYIEGPTRGDLELVDLNGADGNYINVTNESDSRVTLSEDGVIGGTVLQIESSTYVDIRGDGHSAHDWNDGCTTSGCYGILVNGVQLSSAMINSAGNSDYIRLRYIEVDYSSTTSGNCSGIVTQSTDLTNSSVLSGWEIDHNFVHGDDLGYAGFYLGNNSPHLGGAYDNPYLEDYSVHHNLSEDLGSYGITLKGISSTNTLSAVYNNIVRASDRSSGMSTGLDTSQGASFKQGIGTSYNYGEVVKIYNNWVEKTAGPCIEQKNSILADAEGVEVYNNVMLGCGQDDDANYKHGYSYVCGYSTGDGPTVYNNTIVDVTGYGIFGYTGCGASDIQHKDNLILAPSLGEKGGGQTEGSGDYANTYNASVGSNFVTWSDDDNYSNDNFQLASGSAAIDASGAAGYPSDDYNGTSRPVGSAADDGAYEYYEYSTPSIRGAIISGGCINCN